MATQSPPAAAVNPDQHLITTVEAWGKENNYDVEEFLAHLRADVIKKEQDKYQSLVDLVTTHGKEYSHDVSSALNFLRAHKPKKDASTPQSVKTANESDQEAWLRWVLGPPGKGTTKALEGEKSSAQPQGESLRAKEPPHPSAERPHALSAIAALDSSGVDVEPHENESSRGRGGGGSRGRGGGRGGDPFDYNTSRGRGRGGSGAPKSWQDLKDRNGRSGGHK